MYVGRNLAGIPDDWSTVENWINEKGKIEFVKKTVKTTYEKKFKNIPTLERYDVPANEEFWSNFPSRGILKKPSTRVSVNNFLENCLFFTYVDTIHNDYIFDYC